MRKVTIVGRSIDLRHILCSGWVYAPSRILFPPTSTQIFVWSEPMTVLILSHGMHPLNSKILTAHQHSDLQFVRQSLKILPIKLSIFPPRHKKLNSSPNLAHSLVGVVQNWWRISLQDHPEFSCYKILLLSAVLFLFIYSCCIFICCSRLV